MFEKELTLAQKVNLWFAVALGVVISAGAIWAIFAIKQLPDMMAFVLGLMALIMIVVTVLRARTAIIGSVDLRWQPNLIARIGFYGVLMAVAVIAGYTSTHPNLNSINIMVVWLVPVIVVTAKLIGTAIEQSELKTKEKLLEIELKLAEIGEQMGKKQAE